MDNSYSDIAYTFQYNYICIYTHTSIRLCGHIDKHVFAGLSVVIQTESKELVPTLKNPQICEGEAIHDSAVIDSRLFSHLFFEFCHSTLLQFSLEELSQVNYKDSYTDR